MKQEIRRAKQVRQDIIEIYSYIYERSPQAAERVWDAIEKSIANLLDMPGLGKRWNSLDPRLTDMRIMLVTPYRNYLIFYRPVPTGIEVYRVVHGARELEQIVDAIDIEFDS